MSILSTPTARPERLFSLLSLVRASDGAIDEEVAERSLAPEIRSEQEGQQAYFRPQRDRAKELLEVAASLGFLEERGGRWEAKGALPETKRQFAAMVHDRLEATPADDPDAVMLRVYAWFVISSEEKGLAALLAAPDATLVADIAADLGRGEAARQGRGFNTTKFNPWKDWMAFLGLGWVGLPGTAGFLPDPTQRLVESLRRKPPLAREMRADKFLAWLASAAPYMDGGPLFEEASTALKRRPPKGQLSRFTSTALRMLHDGGDLEFISTGDAARSAKLEPDPVHKLNSFTDVRLGSGT